ncbi:hypothetical protein [Lentzea albidocapillata]|uniref:Uncharacterized protein n=1 Tax=Lentzea albidocapillata TaxID=40571 RepID=A0A1W2DGR6_9PSEU|nr:hypothetical protein [Lentzea albidocapillata]SMC96504.1 hypothetical protein SAMN05660733_03004 [Lentzea albidocapillata]
MSKSFSADPNGIAAVGQGFAEIEAYFGTICEGGQDRIALLLEACGDDDDGQKIKENLHDPAFKIEGAFTSINAVVGNQTRVTNGMRDLLNAMEHDNTSNINHGLKR